MIRMKAGRGSAGRIAMMIVRSGWRWGGLERPALPGRMAHRLRPSMVIACAASSMWLSRFFQEAAGAGRAAPVGPQAIVMGVVGRMSGNGSAFAAIYDAALQADEALMPEQKAAIRRILTGKGKVDDVQPILLTQQQACRALGVSRFTVHRLVRDGHLHPVSIRAVRRYRRSEIEALAAAGTP